MNDVGRHERGVAHTLGFAREAAASGDFKAELEWLAIVEVIDGVLPAGWERTRAVWRRGGMLPETGGEPSAAAGGAGGSRERAR